MVSPSKRSAKKVLRAKGRKIYVLEKPAAAMCAICGTKLHGVPKRLGAALSKLSKTQKRPQRPFGGVLCAGCTGRVLKAEARVKRGTPKAEIDYALLKYARV